ncbi:hypothetical protein BGZ88_008269 [Linnemannia elongata]|nr:hypothetical protein BGZ88_008269 [Linnemannia elongata]
MSHPTPRKSALTKRKADGDSLTGLPKINKLRFANENEINPAPSPPIRLTPSPPRRRTLERSKSFSLPTGKEDDNFSDKVNCDPAVFIPKYRQDPSNAIQDDQQPSKTVGTVHQPENTAEANQQHHETVTNDHQPDNFPDFIIPNEVRLYLRTPSRDSSKRRAKNDTDIVRDDQQPDPTVEANQQPNETVETVHQLDNTAGTNHQRDEAVKIDQQAMHSFSDLDYHKTLKIKVIDATDTIPHYIMEVDYRETVAGLKNLIILLFLKEEELHPCRIRLLFISDSVAASTGRQLPDHWLIREKTPLGDVFGDEPAFEDGVNVKVKVQILPVSSRSSPVSF